MPEKIKHVAVVMDGNRRWAKDHALPKHAGHAIGAQRVEPTVEHAANLEIPNLTLWAYSTENANRSRIEQRALMNVFRTTLRGPAMNRLIDQGIQLRFLGDLSVFPKDIQKSTEKLEERSDGNDRMTLAIGLNYGGRDEIKRAYQRMLTAGITDPDEVTEEIISDHLDTTGMPDPDLIIRTGVPEGDTKRTSGFLPWQSAYSEWHFEPTLWPDFTEETFDNAVEVFNASERRFGK